MRLIGVGIDTARYGHVASFVREDRNPAAPALEIREERAGYEKLRRRLEALAEQRPGEEPVQLLVRIDAAGQYAANLLAFLQGLPLPLVISVGEPKRNRDYHQALSPKHKSDKSESWAMALYALSMRPAPTPMAPPEFVALREIAGRLQARSRQATRHVNQLHNLVSRTFPELEFHAKNLSASYALKLLAKYPTAEKIAAARLDSLKGIAYLKEDLAEEIHQAAQQSVASFRGPAAEQLVKQAVRDVQQALKVKKQLENLLREAYGGLPEKGQQHLTSILGIGETTAAVLTAIIGCIDRFQTDKQVISYFGAFPELRSSGFHRDGTPKAPTHRMSQKGNDLVRAYLWTAAQTASRCNPDVRALYVRKRAEGKRGDTALGHCMRKLLIQVFHVWKTQQPFQPHTPTEPDAAPQADACQAAAPETKAAAGPKVVNATSRQEVTAASGSVTDPRRSARPKIDYAHLRCQITFRQVLEHLDLLPSLRGSSVQLRGPCPLHGCTSPHSRSLSVSLEKNVFRCFDPECQREGNVLDFWAHWHGMTLYDAARHLAQTFTLQLTPNREEEPVCSETQTTGDITPVPY